MKPAAALACALCLAAPPAARAQDDSQARREQRAAARQAGADEDARAKADEEAVKQAAAEGVGAAEEAEGGKKQKSADEKYRQKLDELSKDESEKVLQKAQTNGDTKGALEDAALHAPEGAGNPPAAVERQAKNASKPDGGGAKQLPGAPNAPDRAVPGGGKTAVTNRKVADPSKIPSSASGRKTMKLMSRWGGALGQEYKTTEPGLPPGDKPAGDAFGPGKPAEKGDTFASSAAPMKPRVMDDLSLAALSGRSQALGAMGLRIEPGADGRPRVLKRDGTPATPEQAQAAVRLLAEQPAALVRRPDFFQALPREHYDALRAAYTGAAPQGAASPAPEFRDIGLQRQRDFQWTRSCSDVSGGCNPYAAESHYERGRDVSPETLETIYRAREPKKDPEVKPESVAAASADGEEPARDLGEADADDERLAEAARAAEGVGEKRSVLGGVAARLKSLLSGVKPDGAGSWNGDARAAAGGPGVSSTGGDTRAAAPAPGSAAASQPSTSRADAAGVPYSAPAAVNDAAPRRAWRGAGLLGLAAAALAAAAVLRRL